MEPKTETKTPDSSQQKVETKAEDKSLLNKPVAGAPEKYSDFKLPDGLTLNPEVMTEAQGIFKGLNLSQDAAQSLVDFHAKQIAEAQAAPFKTVTAMKADWEGQLTKQYGDDIKPGGKVNVAISRVIDQMPKDIGDAFRQALDYTLGGSHPGIVNGVKWFADKFGEPTTVKGNGPSPLGQKGPDAKPMTAAQALYPHLKSTANQS